VGGGQKTGNLFVGAFGCSGTYPGVEDDCLYKFYYFIWRADLTEFLKT